MVSYHQAPVEPNEPAPTSQTPFTASATTPTIADQFLDKLKTLNDINIQLNRTESFDELCYQGIKLGIERLGFDRLSLWFLENTHQFMRGTFGVDENGHIRDERQQKFNYGSESVMGFSEGRKQAYVTPHGPLLNDRSQVIGEGWHIAVPLLDGDQYVGYMTADNLINQRPLLDYQPELLQLYGSTIGYLARSKQEQETVRKLRQAIQQSSSMVILCDVSGRIEYVNPAFTAVSGYASEMMLDNTLEFVMAQAGLGADYPHIWAQLTAGIEWRDQWHNRKASGEFYDSLVSISPVKNPEGHIVHFVMVQEDITERKRREAQEIALKLEREQVNLLHQFIADVAHEFKTPLTIINTKAYLIRRSLGPAAPLDHLRVIEEQVEQTNMMLNDMLTMMQLAEANRLNLERVDLGSIIHYEIQNFRKRSTEKALRWHTHLHQQPLLVQADADRLTQALHEIFDNAVTFTEPGGSISIHTAHAGNQLIIRIHDSGIGIDRDELPKVFAPFYRVNKARTQRGTGLGLSIVKRIVELHGGSITLSSQPGQGVMVELRLPAR